MTNLNEQYEKIEVNGKSYLKPVHNYSQVKEFTKAGSFINVLANKFSLASAPGRVVSHWR